MLITDDFTRMSWVFFLILKSDAFEKFQEFKAFVKKESCHQIRILQIHRGGEFLSNKFTSFWKQNGLKRRLAVRRTLSRMGSQRERIEQWLKWQKVY